jgi:hypothetical protein
VGNHGQRSRDTQRYGGEKGGRDHHAVDEFVKGIAYQDERAAPMAPGLAVFVMAVAPDDPFLQHEKNHRASQHRAVLQIASAGAISSPLGIMSRKAAPSSVPVA